MTAASDVLGRHRPRLAPSVSGPWRGGHLRAEHLPLGRRDGVPVHVAGLVRHPLLERVTERRRWAVPLALAQGLLSASVFVVAGLLHLVLTDAGGGATAVVLAVLTLLVLGFAARAHRRLRGRVVEAGTRVVALLDAAGGGAWVETDRLAEVELVASRRGVALALADRDGRRVTLPCGLLEANDELWGLVHAAITRSVRDGARVGPRARRRLRLPAPHTRNEQE